MESLETPLEIPKRFFFQITWRDSQTKFSEPISDAIVEGAPADVPGEYLKEF